MEWSDALPLLVMYAGLFCCLESVRPSPTWASPMRCYHLQGFNPSRRKRHIDFLSVFILL